MTSERICRERGGYRVRRSVIMFLFYVLGVLVCAALINRIFFTNKETDYLPSVPEAVTASSRDNSDMLAVINMYKSDSESARLRAEAAKAKADKLEDRLKSAEVLAGMTEVSGRGLVLIMEDSVARSPGVDKNNYVLHNEDLLNAVNVLRNAGALAISINGERLSATSEIYCMGAVVNVNRTPLAPPFIICALGNPKTLEGALRLPGGVYESLSAWGFKLTLSSRESLKIPSLREEAISCMDEIETFE